jgi:branched-chain amino acid transport system permease protein
MSAPAATIAQARGQLVRARMARYGPWALTLTAVTLALIWILFIAHGTTFGSAVHDPKDFAITLLNGVTAAGLYFVVASGFTLIFGLMRVVNMAHGSLFLLGGYIALTYQKKFTHAGIFGLTSDQVKLWEWVVPLLIATAIVAVSGLFMQQVVLRWNQGQELRQALITIAISIIAADQILAHFVGGGAEAITWPRNLGEDKFVHLGSINYTWYRLFILFLAIGIGLALYLWLQRTRTGMVIRAGVDDRAMVSALGINIQLVFALAFLVGSGLAGLGGVIGGSFAGLDVGVDGQWLLNSLIVVIIGGMGSLGGAAVGSLLLGLTTNLSAAYLPSNYTYYSIIFTFALLTLVLAVRPLGLFGRPA